MEDNAFIKIIVVGEQSVGKTCLLARYSKNQFDQTCPPTLGMDFQSKLLQHKDQTFKLQLWDIAGQERYNSVSKLYVRGAAGAVVVTDINNESSLHSSIKWKKMIEEQAPSSEGTSIPIILVQNKVDDLKGIGQVAPFQTNDQLQVFAKQHGFTACLQASAKDNINVSQIFIEVVDAIIAQGRLNSKEMNYAKPTDNYLKPAGNNQQNGTQMRISGSNFQKQEKSPPPQYSEKSCC